ITNKEYILKIIGDGSEKKSLIELSKKLEINERVIFKGQVTKSKVIHEMEKSEVFILVSQNETLGLVYLEAMSQGCLTIGTNGEGIDGIIINNVNGFLCNSDDLTDIQNTLDKVVNLPIDRKKEISENAINTMENYTTEKVANDYLE